MVAAFETRSFLRDCCEICVGLGLHTRGVRTSVVLGLEVIRYFSALWIDFNDYVG